MPAGRAGARDREPFRAVRGRATSSIDASGKSGLLS